MLGVLSLPHEHEAEHNCEKQAQHSYDDVAKGQEVVLSSESVGGRKHKGLLALEGRHIVIVINRHFVGACFEWGFDSSPEFSEVRQSCCSHPDDEMLVLHANPLNFLVVFALHIIKLVLLVRRPGDVLLADFNLITLRSGESERIIEETLGNETTGGGWILKIHFFSIEIVLLVLPEVTHLDNGIAVA